MRHREGGTILVIPTSEDTAFRVIPHPLLITKLRPPNLRARSISRFRLLERIADGQEARLILVTAPAGFGKTTLLCQWINQIHCPVAWLTLDKTDNDVSLFWEYIITSIRTAVPEVGNLALELLQSSELLPIPMILIELINSLTTYSKPVILMIDDYHLIMQSEVHASLIFLIEHAPSNLSIVIASRTSPPLPLSRLRANGQLYEILTEDLRASQEETARFLAEVMKLELPDTAVQQLAQRTEGWLAGLQLAALSLRGQTDIFQFLKTFSGSNRLILNYLLDEVLRYQPTEIQQFLLETSILDQLSAPLCDAVTGRNNSQAILAGLERDNLFLIALDEEQVWYRYHTLFADLLRDQLTSRKSTSLRDLHARAARWYERQNNVTEAIRHYQAADEIGQAASLISKTAITTLSAGNIKALMGCLDMLPDEITRSFPRLSLAKAWVVLLTKKPEIMESLLQPVTTAKDSGQTDWTLHSELTTVRTWLRENQNNDTAFNVEGITEDGLWLRGTVALSLGTGYYYQGNSHLANIAFQAALQLLQAAEDRFGVIVALLSLGDIARGKGQLNQARVYYRKILEVAVEPGGQLNPMAGHALVGLAKIACETFDLPAANKALEEALNVSGNSESSVSLNAYLTISLVRHAMGDATGALEALTIVEEIARENRMAHVIDRVNAFRVQLYLKMKMFQDAYNWFNRSNLSVADQVTRKRHAEYITLSKVLIHSEKYSEALELLDKVFTLAQQQGRLAHQLEALVLQTVSLIHHKDQDLAVTTLQKALALAQPEGFIRPFVLHGDIVLATLLKALPTTDFIDKILSSIENNIVTPVTQSARTSKTEASFAPEALTDRESTVLRLLVGGMTNKEIAKEIYVSVNTVKTHIRNIYSKLNVTSRSKLVKLVTEHNLLG